MRLIVCGGREYGWRSRAEMRNLQLRLEGIQGLHPDLTIIEGGGTGADALAWFWADTRGLSVETCEADWSRLGKSAGPIRNEEMATRAKADALLAFPGGRGTQDMLRRARRAGIPIIE